MNTKANKVHVKKGDTVIVINGKDESKKGKVLSVNPDNSTVLVEGVNIVKKHKKPRSQFQQGGIVPQESPIHSSKVMLVCNKCGKPTRIAKKVHENGDKDRACKKCGEVIDNIKSVKK